MFANTTRVWSGRRVEGPTEFDQPIAVRRVLRRVNVAVSRRSGLHSYLSAAQGATDDELVEFAVRPYLDGAEQNRIRAIQALYGGARRKMGR